MRSELCSSSKRPSIRATALTSLPFFRIRASSVSGILKTVIQEAMTVNAEDVECCADVAAYHGAHEGFF